MPMAAVTMAPQAYLGTLGSRFSSCDLPQMTLLGLQFSLQPAKNIEPS